MRPRTRPQSSRFRGLFSPPPSLEISEKTVTYGLALWAVRLPFFVSNQTPPCPPPSETDSKVPHGRSRPPDSAPCVRIRLRVDQGPQGPRRGAQAARHVYRRHRRWLRPPPHGLRGGRQRHRRSARGFRQGG